MRAHIAVVNPNDVLPCSRCILYMYTSNCANLVGVRFVGIRHPSANATAAVPVGYGPNVSRRDVAIIRLATATNPPPFCYTHTRSPLCHDNGKRAFTPVDRVPRYRNQFNATMTRSPAEGSLLISSCSMLSDIVCILLFKTIAWQVYIQNI